jgi:hypothetical protein
MSAEVQVDSFTAFAKRVTPRLKAALVAAVGVDRAPDAAAEALAYGWEHWDDLRAMDIPAGYLYRVAAPSSGARQQIAVTRDGTVWGAWFNPTFSYLPAGLARYHADTGIWEPVRPLGGDLDLPAMLAPTPSGNLWVLVADVPEWPLTSPRDRVIWTGPSTWALAYLDVTTGDWSIYDVPEGYPGDMVADDEAVWFERRSLDFGESTLVRFDHQTWMTYSHPPFDNLGVADDGTLWVSNRTTAGLQRLVVGAEGGASQ